MKVVITGGGGVIGRRLAQSVLDRGVLTGADGRATQIDKLVIFDVVAPQPPLADDPRLEVAAGDIGDPETVNALVSEDCGAVFHLAAVVSAGAEEDFELGMSVNMKGTMNVLDACRRHGTCPRVIFASSVAVFGGDMPEVIQDGTALNPQTSYGAQKAISEHLINDYSRRGFVDGRALRLPTIVVRPGKPNKAASTWASSILREPLQGDGVVCPVEPDQLMWILSPRRVVEAFIRAAELPAEAWGVNRVVALPGITRSVQEMVEALTTVAGKPVAERIRWQPDPFIQKIVWGWPTRFAPERATALGFTADGGLEEIIEAFITDELGGTYVA
jgi:nucleoside-diphosphate-sugar epimerase